MRRERGGAKRRKRYVLAAAAFAGVVGLVTGVAGGAAGAFWVIDTLGPQKTAAAAKNAVLSYEDMPAEGIRPVDIAGLSRTGTPLHPCVIPFLEANADIVGEADWQKVRFNPDFKSEDIINEIAFARGVIGITRQDQIHVAVPNDAKELDQLNERLFFHELMHVAQYAAGLDIGEYATSAVRSYAAGDDPKNNIYEEQVRDKEKAILDLWYASEERRVCHPDVEIDEEGANAQRRAPSEQPEIKFAIFDSRQGNYRVISHQLHTSGGLARPTR